MPIDVVLIEDRPLSSSYLIEHLTGAGFRVVGTGNAPASAPPRHGPMVVVVDSDAVQTHLGARLRSLRASLPEARILVIGRTLTNEDLCGMLLLGIHGFVPYQEVRSTLRQAIKSVAEGHLWVKPDVLERFVQHASGLHEARRSGHKVFTGQEELVLGLLERRLCDKEISVALGITERTVRFHVQNIFAKLGVHDRHSVAGLGERRVPAQRKALASATRGLRDLRAAIAPSASE